MQCISEGLPHLGDESMKVAESKVSPQWATNIPKEVRPWLKVGKGETIEWHVEDGKVEVRKKEA